MISGVHAIFYSREAERVRAFLGDVLGWRSVDAGEGWPIFAGPPLELAVHPTDGEPEHELFLMCDDITATVATLTQKGIEIDPIADRGWGLVTTVHIPGGDEIGLYEPRHPSPIRP